MRESKAALRKRMARMRVELDLIRSGTLTEASFQRLVATSEVLSECSAAELEAFSHFVLRSEAAAAPAAASHSSIPLAESSSLASTAAQKESTVAAQAASSSTSAPC